MGISLRRITSTGDRTIAEEACGKSITSNDMTDKTVSIQQKPETHDLQHTTQQTRSI